MAGDFGGTEVFGRQRRVVRPNDTDPRRPGALLGVVAAIAAVATVIVVIVGIRASVSGDYATGTTLAYVATGLSIVAVLGGLGAVFRDRGRGWGAIAIVIGLAANPLVLTQLLRWVSGLG
jgi:hypothetical protein